MFNAFCSKISSNIFDHIFKGKNVFLMLRKLTAEKSVKNFHNKIDNFAKC